MKGFTLIELIVVIAITAVLSVIGIAAFVNYSRTQALNAAVREVETMLQVAKSRAQSQVKPDFCQDNNLIGYKVSISVSNRSYKLDFVCQGIIPPPAGILEKNLPTNIIFDASLTTITSVEFAVLSGTVTGFGNIKIKGYNDQSKTITIDPVGNISVSVP